MASAIEPPGREQTTPPTAVLPPKAGMSEDWLAVCIGLFIFVLSFGVMFRVDLLGWAISTNVWTVPSKALAPASAMYSSLPPLVSLLATFVFFLVVMMFGA
jgi:hypothetical protein